MEFQTTESPQSPSLIFLSSAIISEHLDRLHKAAFNCSRGFSTCVKHIICNNIVFSRVTNLQRSERIKKTPIICCSLEKANTNNYRRKRFVRVLADTAAGSRAVYDSGVSPYASCAMLNYSATNNRVAGIQSIYFSNVIFENEFVTPHSSNNYRRCHVHRFYISL